MLEMAEETMPEKKTPEATMHRTKPALRGLERVVLTGFMGSGKTTVGRLLAERLGWEFHDLDTEVERRTGMSVPQIFAENGETAFRRHEYAALASLLGQAHTVIALGGGAPETLGNQLLLEQTPKTAVVYLAAPLETLLERCEVQAQAAESTERPLLGEAAARFKTRHPLYERIARHKVITTRAAPKDVVGILLDVLENRG
jgi:shikimate kinase